MNWTPRLATMADVPALEELIRLSARSLLPDYYPPSLIEVALGPAFGVDVQLIEDGTYYVVETGGHIVGCGGWSRRLAEYGGHHTRTADDTFLDAATDAARIRAFFVHPEWVRQGIGRRILLACEAALVEAGFSRVTMVATLGGEPLYSSCGYTVSERFIAPLTDGSGLPVVRMTRVLQR